MRIHEFIKTFITEKGLWDEFVKQKGYEAAKNRYEYQKSYRKTSKHKDYQKEYHKKYYLEKTKKKRLESANPSV